MAGAYVHIEVTELRDRPYRGIEADVRVVPPEGHAFSLIVQAGGTQQPFWRVTSVEPVGSPEILDAVFAHLSPEEFHYRISVALTLFNLWDSAKASSDRLREWDQERDD